MRLFLAMLASVAFHALIALGIACYLRWSDGAVELAALDLTSGELSFAEKDDDAAPSSPVLPAPPPEKESEPEPDPPPPPPEFKAEEMPIPPEMDSVRLPEPEPEDPVRFDPVRVEDPEPVQKPPEERPEPTPVEQAPVPAVAPKAARIDAPPKPVRRIRPDYPKGARQRGEEGEVTLEMRVNERGTVDEVKVARSCGFPELDAAAVSAARKAVFTPAKRGREPVASNARLKLEFRLK